MRYSLASLLVYCCCAGIFPSEKRQGLRWCSGRWCQVWQGGGVLFLSLKMSQNSIDDVLILDASDYLYRPTAAGAELDVYIEYALESLSPGHRRMSLRCRADLHIGNRLDSFSTPGWRDQPSPAVVRCEYAVVSGEVDPRLRHQCRQSRYEIHGVKCHLRRSIAVGRLQCINHLASGTE